MKRVLILLAVVVAVMAAALGATASHVADGGVDQTWVEAMNHEPYWEGLWGAECTKYETHSGFIPAAYDAAVVHDGQRVRVYSDLSGVGAFTALGAVNPANGKHFGAPHSWVMKCTIEEGTTTTTVVEETTTTVSDEESTTTTSTLPEATTTTVADQETTTTAGGSTTTTEPPTYVCEDGEVVEVLPGDPGYPGPVTDPRLVECDVVDPTVTTAPTLTTVTTAPEELPFTGASPSLLILAAGVLLSGGGLVLRSVRGEE